MPEWVSAGLALHPDVGLPATLRVSAIAVVGSALIGILLGTLITIEFAPSRALIRLYIEVFRGLPILVTVFMVYFGLPDLRHAQVRAPDGHCDRARPLGQRPGRRGHARRGPVDPARAARGGGGARLRLERPSRLRDPAAGAAPAAAALRQPARQHHPELDAGSVIGGVEILLAAKSQSERLSFPPPIGIGEIKAFEIFAGVMILFFLISFPLTRLAAVLEKRLA